MNTFLTTRYELEVPTEAHFDETVDVYATKTGHNTLLLVLPFKRKVGYVSVDYEVEHVVRDLGVDEALAAQIVEHILRGEDQ